MISFLIPTKTRIDLFQQAFGSLLVNLEDCPEEWEIIVLNDSPENDSSGMSNALDHMGIKYIYGGGKGIANAYNKAAWAASGDKLVFVNDDIFFFQPFIQPMLQAYDRGYSIVGVKLLYPNMTIQHAGCAFMKELDWQATHLWRFQSMDEPGANEFKEMATVTYSLAMIDSKLYYDLGGIDLRYQGNYEDTDFSLRALESGHKICYEPRSVAIHHEAATRGHNIANNSHAYDVFKEIWVSTGRLEQILLKKGFIDGAGRTIL